MDFSNVLKNIDLTPTLQSANTGILRRSARELAQDMVSNAISKPVFSDNWDIVVEYPIENFIRMAQSFVGIFTSLGSSVNLLTGGRFTGGTGLSGADNLRLSGRELVNSLRNAGYLLEGLQNTVAMQKLSVRTQEVNVPAIEVNTEQLRFGPLRYHYITDYEFKNLSMTIMEDEETPLYPIFDAMLRTGIDFDTGTILEPGKSRVNVFLTNYSDFTGFPYITYSMFGCHVKKLVIGSGGDGTTFTRDNPDKVEPVKIKVDMTVDDFRVTFNKLNPLISLGSRVLPINQLVGKGNNFIKNILK